jgi:heme exporter protein D
MVPDLDPVWATAFWVVMGLAVGVSITAIWILVVEYLAERRADPPTRSVIRERLRQLPRK